MEDVKTRVSVRSQGSEGLFVRVSLGESPSRNGVVGVGSIMMLGASIYIGGGR